MFPDDDRVVALFVEARRKFGDDILRDPRRSVPMLADQAPELRGTIKGVAGALIIGAAQRLRATADQASEFHRLATEIAGREGVAMSDAMAGVRIAARLGGEGPAVAGPPADRSWVGGSVVAGGRPGQGAPGFGAPVHGVQGQGMPPPPVGGPGYGAPGYGQPGYGAPGAPPGAPSFGMQDFMRAKWGIAALLGVGILVVIGLSGGFNTTEEAPPAPQSGPGPSGPSQPGGRPQQPGGQPQQPGGQPQQPGGRPPQQAGGLPIIVPPGGGQQLPAIQVRDAQQMYLLEFGASAGNQVFRVFVGVSKQGWGSGIVGVASQGANEPESLSAPGPFNLSRENNNAVRVMQPSWQRDGLNIGTMCVAFVQTGAPDVQLRGSNVCVLSGNCDKMVGCGTVQ
jgi:hypothetical protein